MNQTTPPNTPPNTPSCTPDGTPELRDGEPRWRREKPERVNDPAIKRFIGHRWLIALARLVTRGRSYEIFRVVSINRRLLRPFLLFNLRLMPFGKLSRRQTELVILRVAAVCESRYEWRQHELIGRRASLTVAEIALIACDPAAGTFSHEDQVLLTATGELLSNHEVTDETWNVLREFLSPACVFELCMLVGNYAMLAGALNTFGVSLEPALRRNA